MLTSALSRVRGLVVAGSFKDGKTAVEHCLKDPPGLLIVDLYLPGMHGLEVVREIRAKLPATRILVLTGHPDGDLPARLISQGGHGFVDKSAPINYLIQAIESVIAGGMFFATNVPPKTSAAGAQQPKVEPSVKAGPLSVEGVFTRGTTGDYGRIVTADFAAGDVGTFPIHTIHLGLDNTTDRLRLSVDCRYQPAAEPADPRWVGPSPSAHGARSKLGLIC